jgi:hypothetical protein
MNSFQKINNITGWTLFILATLVYAVTLEMTASYWDAGEFIAVSYKLMVPHPPGAPFYLLMGRIFSFLAFGDVERVAFWINMLSVISSALTILFMYWSIVLLGRKLMDAKIGEETRFQTWTLVGAGIVGSLAYTFSDSFWFSAVEAEVYAMSSFFTAFVVWAILKWDLIEDESTGNKWLILIAYMMGLSVGVHLLNLVTIPALALIYYFKKRETYSWRSVTFTILVAGIIILIINDLIIPGLPSIAGSFEIFFVNALGLPFGSGVVVFMMLFIGALVYGIVWSQKNEKDTLNTALLAFAFILIGYASYAVIVIRSSYDPPIDENDPENTMSVVSYLKREQYGSRPLIFGPYFTAEVIDQELGDPVYVKGEEKYEIADRKLKYIYDPTQESIFPRAWSSSGNHPQRYREILGLRSGEVPTFSDNIVFLFKHQLGHMYMRYFMWNFAGRESDIQDAGWLDPISALEETPESIKNNRGRNNYFMIPLLLGLIGLFYTYRRNWQVFSFLFTLFLLLGIALIIYLNSPPVEPRERDYIYVGSYYAFALWIGLAVIGIAQLLYSKIKNGKVAVAMAVGIGMIAPILMATQNWDDHDRSNRYFSVDSAKNFLASCAPNAILFTGGDNDTFPLWYVQEVEGFRTDVRVVVLSYANTDWYIEQMTRPAYESEAFPYTLDISQYRQGGPNDVLFYRQLVERPVNLKQYIKFIKDENPQLKSSSDFGEYNLVPSKDMFLDIDTAQVLSMGIIPKSKEDLLIDRMDIKVTGNVLEKKDLMILDLISTNNWERPIYFNNTSRQGINFDLGDYLIQEGQAFRLLPIKNNSATDFVNTELMYENMMNNFFYRELDNPNSYYNEDYRNFVLNHRSSFNTLTSALIKEKNETKASEVLNASITRMPDAAVPYDYTSASSVDLFMQLGETEKGKEIAEIMAVRSDEQLDFYIRTNINLGFEVQKNLVILQTLSRTMDKYGETELAEKYNDLLRLHYNALSIFEDQNR